MYFKYRTMFASLSTEIHFSIAFVEIVLSKSITNFVNWFIVSGG